MKMVRYILYSVLAAICAAGSSSVAAEEPLPNPTTVTYRVLGLFSPDRVTEFRLVMKEIPAISLVSISYETSEATFEFDPKRAFPTAPPEKYLERFDNEVRTQTRGVFGLRAACETPRDKLKFVEIGVVGLDCPGCCLAAYESINKLEGVEQATASFRAGLVTAWIDPAKTTRDALEEALKKKNVQLVVPAEKPAEK